MICEFTCGFFVTTTCALSGFSLFFTLALGGKLWGCRSILAKMIEESSLSEVALFLLDRLRLALGC